MNYYPTVNEIVYQREDRSARWRDSFISNRPNKFKVGDIVEFTFSGLRKIGRITTALCRSGICVYNIETRTHQWFQKIDEQSILSKIE